MTLRVTDQGLARARAAWINQGRSRMATSEQQIASGKRLTAPSDDPTASSQLMRHETLLARINQFGRNADNARLWVDATDHALQATSANLSRAKTLAVQAGNDILGPEERAALASDVRSIADELLSVSNNQVAGRSLFAGTADTTEAYDGTGTYLGDNGTIDRTIDAGYSITVSLTGPQVFGTPDAVDPYQGTTFQVLWALADAIDAGDNAQIQAGMAAVNDATARVGQGQGRVGAASQQLDASGVRHETQQLAAEAHVSSLGDTDIAEGIIQLRSAEASYEATLSASARSLSRSLLDFLR